MRGILRTALLLCSWVPLQRRLLAIGLVLTAVGHLGQSKFTLSTLALISGLALAVLPSLIVGGTMFRIISAPRTMHLAPHARLQMLLGVLLGLMIMAAFFTANMELLRLENAAAWPAGMRLSRIFAATMAVETVLLFGMFFISRYALAVWFFILIAQISAPLLARLPIGPAVASRLGVVNVIVLLTAGVWAVFAAWYLRARRIAPPMWADASAASSRRPATRERSIHSSRKAAIAIHLLGLPSIGRLVWRGIFVFVVSLIVMLTTILRPGAMMPNTGASFLFVAFCLIAFLPIVIAAGVAHRSRLLWIRSGCTRKELFQTCERLIWSCFATIGMPMLLLCLVAWVFLPHQATDWPYLLAMTLASALCSLYLGLMNVAGWRLLDVTAAVLIVLLGLGVIVGPLFANAPLGSASIVIPVMGSLGALSLRAIAQQRWRRIDWLICKPPRLSSQALRPVI